MEIKAEYGIVPVQRELTPAVWQMISQIAPVMWKSRLFGVGSPEAATAIMLKGYELGLSITASFEFVQVVEGKPSLSPRGALAILHKSTEIAKIETKRLTDASGKFTGYECTMKRRNGFEHTAKYTLEDAQRAGVFKPNSGWAKYPENMCLWRVIGFTADVVAPDITAGMTSIMKMPEELGVAIDGNGYVVDVKSEINSESKPVNSEFRDYSSKVSELIEMHGIELVMASMAEVCGGDNPKTEDEYQRLVNYFKPSALPESLPVVTLDDLISQYGAEKIVAANMGKVPSNDTELQAIWSKLSGQVIA